MKVAAPPTGRHPELRTDGLTNIRFIVCFKKIFNRIKHTYAGVSISSRLIEIQIQARMIQYYLGFRGDRAIARLEIIGSYLLFSAGYDYKQGNAGLKVS
jgi:hypothetical protein